MDTFYFDDMREDEPRVWFITAFMRVDYTHNPDTIELLNKCGNAFASEAEAITALKKIQGLLCAKNSK